MVDETNRFWTRALVKLRASEH